MNTQPLVSVLTPCYNSGDYLEGCIQSVLAQDYPHVEHVIQDGGSKDATLDILRRYTGRVDWVSELDKGQADGLNKAMQRCRGDIFVVLNADDELLPNAVSWAVKHLAENPGVAAIYGDQHNIDAAGHIFASYPSSAPYDFEKVFCVEQIPPAQATFIRRECMEAVGWHVDVTRRTCPDYEMWVRLGLKFPVRHVPGFVARYRVHPQSEGCQSDLTPAMAASKREVMDRVLNDPSAPPALRRLRRRAHAGVTWWSADLFASQGEIERGLSCAARTLALYPHLRQWRKLPGYLVLCLRISLRKLRRATKPKRIAARDEEKTVQC